MDNEPSILDEPATDDRGVFGDVYSSSSVENVRTLYINDPDRTGTQQPFVKNYVSSCKYSLLNFLALFLFEQFKKASNIFFFAIILIQQIPGVSPTGRFSTLIPLLIVTSVTALKEILEDRKRYMSDQELNNSKVSVLRNGAFVSLRWADLRPGDVLRIKNDEFFPADCVLLSSSEPQGLCYVETSNLDGETNLKLKTSSPLTRSYVKPSDYNYLRSKITCEHPNNRLYSFFGNLIFQYTNVNITSMNNNYNGEDNGGNFDSNPGYNNTSGVQRDALGPSSLLLRGCQLKNTSFVYCLVAYTGVETKLLMNMTSSTTKMSHVDTLTNKLVFSIFFWLLALASVSAIISMLGRGEKDNNGKWYLDWASNKNHGFVDFVYTFLTFIILYTNLIPISLILNVEIVKYAQALIFIKNDTHMCDKKRNVPANARTSSLNEDLGCVQYVFTDKTGTLTRNVMKLKHCSIAGKIYGNQKLLHGELGVNHHVDLRNEVGTTNEGDNPFRQESNRDYNNNPNPFLDDAQEYNAPGPSRNSRANSAGMNDLDFELGYGEEPYYRSSIHSQGNYNDANNDDMDDDLDDLYNDYNDNDEEDIVQDFNDASLLDDLINVGSQTSVIIRQFLTHLAVCHTVIPEVSKIDPDAIIYQAQSPDEGALVNAVKNLGFSFNVRTPESITVNVMGRDETYDILKVLEFTSDRKRMSVIVRTPQNKIQIMCKGADSVIFERLSNDHPQPFRNKTLQDLKVFAGQGLRTLCLAIAEISEKEYIYWEEQYDTAWQSTQNHQENIDKVADQIEKNLFLLGATAIEDKLQAQVPETLQALLIAGIKVWMLTGDKQETAVNIAFSCGLFDKSMDIMVLSEIDSYEAAEDWLAKNLTNVEINNVSPTHVSNLPQDQGTENTNQKKTYYYPGGNKNIGLVVDGRSLAYALMPGLQEKFIRLSVMCKSVICCRAMPIQKADLVSLVRAYRPNAITLAIGDGANDVGMIQRAHVGIGISGQEGLQAVRSADYSIAQFRFLKRLLLVHGQLSLRRTSKLILYSFYKNICLYMIEFFYAMTNDFSGQPLLDPWLVSVYNIFFTSFPTLCLGLFERTLRDSTLMDIPQLYTIGLSNKIYNKPLFWRYVLNSLVHSAMIFILTTHAFKHEVISRNGLVINQWILGLAVFTTTIFTVLLKCASMFDTFNNYSIISFAASIVVYIICVAIYSVIWPSFGYEFGTTLYGSLPFTLGNIYFIFTTIAIALIVMTPDYIIKNFKRILRPEDYSIIQEMEAMKKPLREISNLPTFSWRKVFDKIPVLEPLVNTGFAFSQEERSLDNTVGQADLIKVYNSNATKPSGA